MSASRPGLLRDREFLKFWGGQSISLLGSQFTLLALPLTAAITLHATPAEMGVLTALQFAPGLLRAADRAQPARHAARRAPGSGRAGGRQPGLSRRPQVTSGTKGRLWSVISEVKHEATEDTKTHEAPGAELARRSRQALRASLCSSSLRASTARGRSRDSTYSGQDFWRPA